MSDFDRDKFLSDVKEQFKEFLDDNIEPTDDCRDEDDPDNWDIEKIKNKYSDNVEDGDSINELFNNAITAVVMDAVVYVSDCWDICREIVGSSDFDEHNSMGFNLINISVLATAALDNYAKEELDIDDLLEEWAASAVAAVAA